MNFNPKTKTALLILQKQNMKQQKNPQLSIKMVNNNQQQSTRNVKIRNSYQRTLGFAYKIYSIEVQPKNERSKDQPTHFQIDLCQLQKQNYRLIEANYNLLTKLVDCVQTVRKQIMKSISYIQQYQYVIAVDILYKLLEKVKKQLGSQQKSSVKRVMKDSQTKRKGDKQKSRFTEQKEKILKQFEQCPYQGSEVKQFISETSNKKNQKSALKFSERKYSFAQNIFNVTIKPVQDGLKPDLFSSIPLDESNHKLFETKSQKWSLVEKIAPRKKNIYFGNPEHRINCQDQQGQQFCINPYEKQRGYLKKEKEDRQKLETLNDLYPLLVCQAIGIEKLLLQDLQRY